MLVFEVRRYKHYELILHLVEIVLRKPNRRDSHRGRDQNSGSLYFDKFNKIYIDIGLIELEVDHIFVLVLHNNQEAVVRKNVESGAPIESELQVLLVNDGHLVRWQLRYRSLHRTLFRLRDLFLLLSLGSIQLLGDFAKRRCLDFS